jgi:hypothetical protein
MGLGFVLICYFVLGAFLALFTGAILAIIMALCTKGTVPRIIKAILAFIFPSALLFYFMAAFIIYGLWCEFVRNVDCGLGDGWKLPLNKGYTLQMIDIPEHGFIVAPDGRNILQGVEQIAMKSMIVFLKTKESPSYHMLDTTNGTIDSFEDQTDFEKYCQNRNLQPPEFQTVNRFYLSRRWTYADIIAVIVILLPFCIAVVGFGLLMRKINEQTFPSTSANLSKAPQS